MGWKLSGAVKQRLKDISYLTGKLLQALAMLFVVTSLLLVPSHPVLLLRNTVIGGLIFFLGYFLTLPVLKEK